MELGPSSLYVDIDALFDTRAGVLSSFGPDAVARAIADGYYLRETDEFSGIERDAFKARYARRDRTTLYESLTTPIVSQIRKFVHQTTMAAINSPYRKYAHIVLNTYPYVLNDDEQQNQILGLRAITKNQADIELIHEPLETLTPQYVKQHFVRLIMYAYWEWLEIHARSKALIESRCQSISLLGPRLMTSSEAVTQLRGTDAFTAIEKLTGCFINLCLLPVSEYCVDLPRFEAFRALRQKA